MQADKLGKYAMYALMAYGAYGFIDGITDGINITPKLFSMQTLSICVTRACIQSFKYMAGVTMVPALIVMSPILLAEAKWPRSKKE